MKKIILILVLAILLPNFSIAKDSNKELEDCRYKLQQAQKLDVLYNLEWKPPKEPKVVVGRTFYDLPFDAKENFVQTVNCFLMAGEGGGINFDILDWRTGKRVGRFSYGKLKMG